MIAKIIERMGLKKQLSVEVVNEKLNYVRKYQSYILIALIIVGCIQVINMVGIPTIEKYAKTKKQLAQYTEILEARQDQTEKKQRIQEEFDRMNEQLEDKMNEFFALDEVEEFTISRLPKLAASNGVKLTDINFRQVTSKGKGMRRHPLSITCKAGFESLMSFFYELEDYSKTIKLSNISVRRTTIDPVELKVSLTLELYSVMGQP